VGQFIYGLRVVRSALYASGRTARRAVSQPLCEIDGGGRGPGAGFTKPDGLGSAVQWNSDECFRNWVYSGQEGFLCASLRQRRASKGIFRPLPVRCFLQSREVYLAYSSETAVG